MTDEQYQDIKHQSVIQGGLEVFTADEQPEPEIQGNCLYLSNEDYADLRRRMDQETP